MKMFECLLYSSNFSENVFMLVNQSFCTGIIPSFLKISRVVPIPKITNPTEASHFRPISITCIFLLLLEKIYYTKLNDFIGQNDFLTKFQFGFRQSTSTEHALIAMTDIIRQNLDAGRACIMISIDFRKAFDSVDRNFYCKSLGRNIKSATIGSGTTFPTDNNLYKSTKILQNC